MQVFTTRMRNYTFRRREIPINLYLPLASRLGGRYLRKWPEFKRKFLFQNPSCLVNLSRANFQGHPPKINAKLLQRVVMKYDTKPNFMHKNGGKSLKSFPVHLPQPLIPQKKIGSHGSWRLSRPNLTKKKQNRSAVPLKPKWHARSVEDNARWDPIKSSVPRGSLTVHPSIGGGRCVFWLPRLHDGYSESLAQFSALSSWWFQPIWKILIKLDHLPNFRGEK